jgi:Lar family restriction alleviation protein
MSEELRECPFCGSEDIEIYHNSFSDDWAVECRECGGERNRLWDEASAVELWNTRPAEDSLREETERLKDRVKRLEFLLSKIQKTSTPHIGGISVCQAELRAINRWCKLALGDGGNNPDTGKGGRG